MGFWGYLGRQAGRLALGLAGAFLLAAGVAALSEPNAASGYSGAFLARINSIAHLDFGLSAITAAPVVMEIARGLPITFELMGAGLVVALVAGIPVGLLFGTGRFFRPAAPIIQVITSIPVFCAALIALWIAQFLGMANFSYAAFISAVSHGAGTVAVLRVIAVPALIAGAVATGVVQLALHRCILAAMREPFYESMQRMGLSGFEIDRAYLAPYLLTGFFKSLGEIALSLFAADAVVEWIFDWPGAINLFIHSVALHDWNAAGVVLLVVASVVMVADALGQTAARAIGGAAP